MLLLLVLCTFLETLWSKPLAPPLALISAGAADPTGGDTVAPNCPTVPDNANLQLRTVYDIVQSCLLTIFACVWTSIHPNINGPRDSWWTCTKRKVVITFYAVIAPEMVLLWALHQHFAAKTIAAEYNEEFKALKEPEMSIWERFRQMFQPLPKSTSRRGSSPRQQWTTTHGFFIQMGGFVLFKNDYPEEVLTFARLRLHLLEGDVDAPIVTARDLQDKSKGDTISKGIVVLQTSWFVLQCIVRAAQHLPLSELEIVTLAFAVVNAAIYAAWWDKPQGVDTAIPVPLKCTNLQNSVRTNGYDSAVADSYQPTYLHSDNNQVQPLMYADEHTDELPGWVRRNLQKDRNKYSSNFFFLFVILFRTLAYMFRPLGKMLASEFSADKEKPRMPMFNSEYGADGNFGAPERIAFIIGLVFGAIHLLGWSLDFLTSRDRELWQVSAVVLTVTPFVLLVGGSLHKYRTGFAGEFGAAIFGVIFAFLLPFYIIARFIVIAIAFKAIIHPPCKVLLDISWTGYIPHF